jgi:Family of unknown function (DUF6152)
MISISRAAVLVIALLAMSSLVVEAHHGVSQFDEKEITLTGVVKEFQFTNPHSWLIVDVTNKDGSVTTWGFEAEGPGVMIRNGIHKSDFTPGTKLTITAHPLKDGQPAGSWVKAVRADGVEFNPRIRPVDAAPTPAGKDPAAPPAGGSTATTK